MAEQLIFTIEVDGAKSISTLNELKETLKKLKSDFAGAKFGTPEFVQLGETIKRVEAESKQLTNSFKEQNNFIPGTVGAIKQELVQLQKQLDNTVLYSKEFDSVLLKIGERKNSLLELKQSIKLSSGDSEQTLKAIAGAAQFVSGSFGLATGAIGLFGDKNKELAETVAKVQSAMLILQSLESIAGSKDFANVARRILFAKEYKKSLDDASNATKLNTTATEAGTVATNASDAATKSSVISLKALKVGLASIGIGLLITAISELIANWDKIKSSFNSTLPIFKALGNYVDEVKQRFVGSFYAIGESIKPVGKFIYDYFTTPFRVAFQSAQILFNVLRNPLSLDNLKKGVSDFGNLFSDTKNKLVNDVTDIQNKFNEGFDKGVNIEKERQVEAERKEIIEKEIKTLEQSVQFIKDGSVKRLQVEQEIINKKLSITEKGSDDYNKLLVDKFKGEESIKDKNIEISKQNVERREKEFADFEKKIKEKYTTQSTVINVTAQVKVNEGSNPGEIEAQRDIEITQNKISELEERKSLYEKYKKDVTAINEELAYNEQTLISQTKKLVEVLKTTESSQDDSNLKAYLEQREQEINQNYKNELTALQNKNLSSSELEKQSKELSEKRDKELAALKLQGLKGQFQNAKDYGKSTVDLSGQIADAEISQLEDALDRKLKIQQEFNDKKLELENELKNKQKQLEEEAFATAFQFVEQSIQRESELQLQKVDERLNSEKERIDFSHEQELQTLEQQKESKLISQAEYETRKKEIDDKAKADTKKAEDKAAKEKRAIARETATALKVENISKIAIDLARAIAAIQLQASILAANPITAPLAPLALAQIPISVGSAAIQTAFIAAQPLPPAQKGMVVSNGNSQRTEPGNKPIVVMQGLTPRYEEGGSIDYAIVNNYNKQSLSNYQFGKTIGYTTTALNNYADGGVTSTDIKKKVINSTSNSNSNTKIEGAALINLLTNNNTSTSTNDGSLDGRVVTNIVANDESNINRTIGNNTTNNNLLANYIENKKKNNYEGGGLPYLIDMGNGQTILYNSEANINTNTGSQLNPIINIGGKYTDDILGISDDGTPIARLNRGEIILTAGVQNIPGAMQILNNLNVQGGGAKFPGFAAGAINQSNTSTTNNNGGSTSLIDISKTENLLMEISEKLDNPNRSYVVESDITEVQKRVQTIKDRASI